MSFFSDIVSTVSKVAEVVAPMALSAIFPPAAMLGPLSNLATSMLGQGLSDVLGQLGKAGDLPNFVAKEAQNMLGGIVSQLTKAVDPGCMQHVADKAGGAVGDLIQNILNDFKDALQNYKNEHAGKGGCGGKGGTGGTGGTGGASSGGTIGFRELAAILAELEGKEAKNVQNAVQKASDALGVAKSGKPEDAQKDADIGAQQFEAMEQSKAEAQIFSALSSAINEVMKKFGEALGSSARA
jgi:hypothetical protein